MPDVHTSSTGGKKGQKPERFSLIPTAGLAAIARVFNHGSKTPPYDDYQWRKGYRWSLSYDALQRHLTAFWDGETNDPDSGLPHLAHAGFHVLVLLTRLAEGGEGGEFDDRYRSEPEVREGLVPEVDQAGVATGRHVPFGKRREGPLLHSTPIFEVGDPCPKCGTVMTTSGGRTPLKCIAAVCNYTPALYTSPEFNEIFNRRP